MIKLLIFDLDGTLFETGPAIHKTLMQIMAQRGIEDISYETVRSAMGKGLEYLIHHLNSKELEKLGDWTGLKKDFHEVYSKIFIDESPLFDGVLDFLDQWPGQLALASNKMERYVLRMIKETALDKYQWVSVSGGDTFEVKKPHPKQLLHALEKAHVSANEALMIGDGMPDIEAAKAANIRSIAVSFGYDDCRLLVKQGAHAHISHYNQLQKTVNTFNNA